MPEETLKRRRASLVADTTGTIKEEPAVKKKKRDVLGKKTCTNVEVNTAENSKLKEAQNEESDKSGSIKTELDNTTIANGSPYVELKRKRKQEEGENSQKDESKHVKTDKVEDISDIQKEKKEVVEKPKVKKILAKRISKNECVCTPEGSQPLQKPEEETDARIQVEEWRLHKFQSPIELKHDDSIHHDHFEPLEFHGHWDESGEATFTNNGFTATLRFQDRELPIIKGGPLHEDEYIFEQLHFHWSEDDHSGCEHIFEGRAYSMEAHAVHFNTKYKDFQEALDKPDGLAVVAFFIQATDNDDHPCFNKLATAVKDIIKVNTTTNVQPDCLTWFKEEAQCKGYYTYQGSLTTEPYTESVTWILYPQPLHVSREQVANFRSLNSTPCEQHNIKKNVRPIQTPPEHKKLNVFFARSHRHSTSE